MHLRFLLPLFLLLATCAGSIADNQVYIWQRVWKDDHKTALRQSHELFSTLRVLGLQIHPQEGSRIARVDTPLLQQDGRPVWLVVRLDGSLTQLDAAAILPQIQSIITHWRGAGVKLTAIEIDYDAPTSRLTDYQQLLALLRQALPPDLTLSITALPAWLSSAHLPDLLAAVDSSVLQLHSVLSPQQGLFDPAQARRWSRQYALISPHPFYLALPAYGSALISAPGQPERVESESLLGIFGERRELSVSPQQIDAFTRELEANPPKNFAGLVWFRLPLANDSRSWSLTTLEAVIRHRPLNTSWQWLALPDKANVSPESTLYELAIKNSGNIDAPLPIKITLQMENCLAADGAGGYRFAEERFYLTAPALLRAGRTRTIGWARCTSPPQGEFYVSP
ncbi:DUF3142 domain-containing protein [Klebsiella oxytoca]|nr:DUF3142 domain-containing protein [Klebsiella oxytoca]